MKTKKIATIIMSLAFMFGTATFISSCNDSGAKSITNLTYNGETIKWSSVKNAQNYKISINNGTELLVSQAEGTIAYQYDAKGEDFDFHIEAVIKEGSDKNPTYSLKFQNIGQVADLDVENGKLTWTTLESAEQYEIMKNGVVVPSPVGVNSFEIDEGDFQYKVRGLKGLAEYSNGNNPYYSIWSEALTGTLLEAPKNITYNSEKFTWEKVTGATSYVIKIGNEEFETSTNSYEYAASNEDFNISVKAIGNKQEDIYDSKYCEEKTYTYIAPIEGLKVEEGVLKWTAPNNAIRYKIKINGIVENEELTTNEYKKLTSGETYHIQVLPVGKSDFYFSRWSNEITVNILRSPVVSYEDSVIRWNEISGCSGYDLKITKNDEKVFSTSLGEEEFVYNYDFAEEGEYLVYVKANSLNIGGVYESKYSNPYIVKRLGTPKNEKIENRPLEQNQVSISFDNVIGAKSYSLLADGVEIATTIDQTNFNVDLTKLASSIEESIVRFEIVAKGEITSEKAVLDSKVSLKFEVTKLGVPQNAQINGNLITWDNVNRTNKYVVTIDGNRTEVTTTSYTLTDLSSGNHTIYVQAMGNGEDVITGSYSNAISINKLEKPTNLNINNGILTWDIVSNATAYKVVLGNENYNADTNAFNLLSYESNISEGVGTQISIYAIGNGSNIVDSDVSSTRTISKLARPTNLQVNGDNLVWNPSTIDSININEYKLMISCNDEVEVVSVSGTSYSLNNFAEGDYAVSVIAIGNYKTTFNSPASTPFVFKKLNAISSVSKEGNKYNWDKIDYASAYEIKLSKDALWTRVETNSYVPSFSSEGEFEISIRAIGNGINVVNSEVYSFTQRVQRLTQPVMQESMTNDNAYKVEVQGNTIKVTIKKNTSATNYKLYVSGIDKSMESFNNESDTEIVFSYTMTSIGAQYIIQVALVGGEFDSNGIYKLDSNRSTEYKVTYTE